MYSQMEKLVSSRGIHTNIKTIITDNVEDAVNLFGVNNVEDFIVFKVRFGLLDFFRLRKTTHNDNGYICNMYSYQYPIPNKYIKKVLRFKLAEE